MTDHEESDESMRPPAGRGTCVVVYRRIAITSARTVLLRQLITQSPVNEHSELVSSSTTVFSSVAMEDMHSRNSWCASR